MQKIIQISECKTTVSETQKLNLREIGCRKLTSFSGYPCIIIGDTMYYDKDFDISGELTVLVNGRAPISDNFTTNDIEITIPDELSQDKMPEFGLTVSDNINVIQVNVPMNDMREYLEQMVVNYWKLDGQFYAGYKVYSQKKIQDSINQIAQYGYIMPTVVICDAMFKTDMHTYIYSLSKLLGKQELPMRVICYKDFRYVANMCEPIYKAICNVPSNQYYSPKDEKDYSDDFIWNYSDKRKVFDVYKKRPFMTPPKGMRTFKRSDWKPEYYIIKGQEENIGELVRQLQTYDANTVIGHSEGQDNTPCAYRAKAFLEGYEYIIDAEDPDDWEFLHPGNMDEFEIYAEADKLDTATLPLKRISYSPTYIDEDNKVLKKFDADLIVSGDRKSSMIGYDHIHKLLDKEHIKVKYVRRKR